MRIRITKGKVRIIKFDPDQPRDESGRWAGVGVSSGSTGARIPTKTVQGRSFVATVGLLPSDKAAFLTPYTEQDYESMGAELHLSENKKGGYALKPNGELIPVFSLPGAHLGHALVKDAISHGAKKLDCLGPFLRDLYIAHGFEVTKTVAWNDAYRPKNWNEEKYDEPDVYEMSLRKAG